MAERSGKRQGQGGVAKSGPGPGGTPTARHFYLDLFTAEERAALAGAVEGNDLEQEVRLLRVLIRRAVAEGGPKGTPLETVSRALGRLAQMMRVQHVIAGEAAKSLDEALAKVLEEIATEVGL